MKFLYQYSAGGSFLHSLDPRTKLLFIAVYLFISWFMPWPWPAVMVAMIILVLGILGDTPPWAYYPFLLYLAPIMIGVTVIHGIIGPLPKVVFLFIPISLPGLMTGLIVGSRLAAMGIAFIAFSLTTDPFDWGLSLYHAGLPYKAAFMFAFAMRFFPLLQEELATIRNALRARGHFGVDTRNPVALVIGAAISIFPLGLGALRRSQTIAMSMELRGFSVPERTGGQRVIFRDVRIRRWDIVVMGLTAIIFLVTLYYLISTGGFSAKWF